jgi:hypothetical protein
MPSKKRQVEEEEVTQPCKKLKAGQDAEETLLNIQVKADGTSLVNFHPRFEMFPYALLAVICKHITERYADEAAKNDTANSIETTFRVRVHQGPLAYFL